MHLLGKYNLLLLDCISFRHVTRLSHGFGLGLDYNFGFHCLCCACVIALPFSSFGLRCLSVSLNESLPGFNWCVVHVETAFAHSAAQCIFVRFCFGDPRFAELQPCGLPSFNHSAFRVSGVCGCSPDTVCRWLWQLRPAGGFDNCGLPIALAVAACRWPWQLRLADGFGSWGLPVAVAVAAWRWPWQCGLLMAHAVVHQQLPQQHEIVRQFLQHLRCSLPFVGGVAPLAAQQLPLLHHQFLPIAFRSAFLP